MSVFESTAAHPLFLRITLRRSAATNQFHLDLYDNQGNHGYAEANLSQAPELPDGTSWSAFYQRYVQQDTGEIDHRSFGMQLFQFLFADDPSMKEAWQGIRAVARDRPLALTVTFGSQTERLARLPVELLHDETGFLFGRPGSALCRTFAHMSQRSFAYPDMPRLLFAWACPPGAGDEFDAAPHEEALRTLFGDRLTVCPRATLPSIEAALNAEPFHFVHILAHGFRDIDLGGVVLHGSGGGPDDVEAQRLAGVLKGRDVRLVFLCSCQTAVVGKQTLSGVAQQLLAPTGGDIPAVVATQANLPVRGSAVLASQFYRLLQEDGHDPASALARARYKAYQDGNAWSVPVFLARPPQMEDILPQRKAPMLPPRRSTFQERRELMKEILEQTQHHRLVSIVGLPGIGKTELGLETTRGLMETGFRQQLVYPQINRTTTTDLLRALIGTAIGLEQPLESDDELAAALAQRSTLLLLDNAEDLMLDDQAQSRFRAQLDTLLAGAPNLQILLTTRWPVSGTREWEVQVDVPPMSAQETEQLLIDELKENGVFREEWIEDTAWQKLLGFLDGHPRSIWLVSRHFDNPRMSPARIATRLEKYRAEAVADPSLIGRQDVFESLSDASQQRILSLKASIDFSFDVLQERHPDATEAFLALSLFPAGLPEYVALEVTGGADGMALDHLYRYHLMEWDRDRTFYPVPLRWYAEQRRQDIDLDEDSYLERGLDAYVDYVQRCSSAYLEGDVSGSVEKWLLEEETLLSLGDWSAKRETQPSGVSPIASIASSGRNILQLTHRLESWRTLAERGLEDAKRSKDVSGEANCLQGLGDLAMRVDDLEGAATYYQEALPLYREIRARLGEANCLQGLGLLALAEEKPKAAFTQFVQVLSAHRTIANRVGEQAAFGYLARTAAIMSKTDQSLVLAGSSLDIGRAISDRFGQTITLDLIIELLQGQKNIHAMLAAIIMRFNLALAIKDQNGIDRYQPILEQIRAQLAGGDWAELESNAEKILAQALAEAEQRLGGHDPLELN